MIRTCSSKQLTIAEFDWPFDTALQRIPIEGKFRQGKNGYRLNYIRAKRADTSLAWINSIFLVMNLLILERTFLPAIKTVKSEIYCH